MDHIEQIDREIEEYKKLLDVLAKQAETIKVRQSGLKKMIGILEDQKEKLSGN